MDFRFKSILHTAGFMLIVLSCGMLPSVFCALYQGNELAARAFMVCFIATMFIGLTLNRAIPRSSRPMRIRDGYLTLILCWVVCTIAALFPYYVSGEIPSLIDSFFESSASLTTTGASIVSERTLSDPIILWKSVCSWLGGVTLIAYMISIQPSFGLRSTKLASIETPGANMASATVKTSDQIKVLYIAYLALTAAEFIMLIAGSSMNSFDALVNTLGSISTAGIFLHPDGIAYYNSLYVEIVVIVFTLLASINFMLYIKAAQRNFRSIVTNIELRTFLTIVAFSTFIITCALYFEGTYDSFGTSLKYALLQVTAFSSTSGFTITDYTAWPALCQIVLFILLFIGGCTASTAGGIKVIRLNVVLQLIRRGFYRRIHTNSVKAVKLGGTAISAPIVSNITSFVALYLGTYLFASIILSLQGLDFSTTLGAAASLLSTAGSSFGVIGNSGNYAMFCPALKLFCSVLMIIGRMELYAGLLLFVPEFWNPNKSRTVI